jgi:hypothetical protein
MFFIQCCDSGSGLIWLSWIRIHIGNADLDSGARKMTNLLSKTDIQPFKKASGMIYDVIPP